MNWWHGQAPGRRHEQATMHSPLLSEGDGALDAVQDHTNPVACSRAIRKDTIMLNRSGPHL